MGPRDAQIASLQTTIAQLNKEALTNAAEITTLQARTAQLISERSQLQNDLSEARATNVADTTAADALRAALEVTSAYYMV